MLRNILDDIVRILDLCFCINHPVGLTYRLQRISHQTCSNPHYTNFKQHGREQGRGKLILIELVFFTSCFVQAIYSNN